MVRFNTNIKEIIEKLQKLQQQGQTVDVSAALAEGVNAAMGAMKNRVFNQSLDANGESLGKYVGKRTHVTERKYKAKRYGFEENEKQKAKKRANVKDSIKNIALTEYEKERLAHGRQIQHKDLEFSGTLRRSIVVAANNNNYVTCIINNESELKIARAQEQQVAKIKNAGSKVPIFSLSDEEKKLMIEQIKNALTQLYARLYNT